MKKWPIAALAGPVIFMLSVVALALLAPSAAADTTAPLYAKMEQRFTTAKPGTSTGWTFDGALKPYPAGEQVPPQRSVTFVFPRGTRFDLSGVENCSASDEQLLSEGLAACPPGSQIISGEGTIFLGMAGTLDLKVYAFVAQPGLGAAFTTESGSVLRVVRFTVDGNVLTAPIPAIQLPGGYESAVTSLTLNGPPAGTNKHPLIRTPKKCPPKGRWKFVYLPQYDEPYGVQRSTSTVHCKRDS